MDLAPGRHGAKALRRLSRHATGHETSNFFTAAYVAPWRHSAIASWHLKARPIRDQGTSEGLQANNKASRRHDAMAPEGSSLPL